MQFHFLRALEARLGQAMRIAPVDVPEHFFAKWVSRLFKKLRLPRRYVYYSEERLDAFARKVEARWTARLAPIVFFGALPFAKCRPVQPYFIYTDSAFFIHYWEYNQDHTHDGSEIERICAAERDFMRRAAGVWCSSQWVADRIQNEYGLEPGKARFVGTGPGDVPPPVQPITYENFLVMIAADFERKGGRLAAEAVAVARRLGCAVSIKFIGARPPADVLELPFVEWCGWLDLSQQRDRQRFAQVMSQAGAQVLLSRVDLTPLAILEAASYSKATIATAVGGIPEMIEDSMTGFLVRADANQKDIADIIVRAFGSNGALAKSGAAARRLFESRWNWDTVTERAFRQVRPILDPTNSPTASDSREQVLPNLSF